MKKVLLGNTGIEVSKVGFGVLTMGATQMNLPEDEGSELISYAIEKGINFFDSAEYYDTYHYMSKALKKTDRDIVISTKSFADTKELMHKAVEDARFALDRDVIDIFLLHEVRGMSDFESRIRAFEELTELRAKGIIKAIGVSTHHVDMCEAASDIKDIDVVFPLINFKGLGIRKGNGFGTAEEMAEAISECASNGKGVYSMKAFGGGNLTGSYSQALDYVFSLKGIDSVMIGMGRKKDVDDICGYIEGTLPEGYQPDVSKKRIHIDQSDCEGCGACMKKCTSKAIYWDKETGLARVDESRCITCGYCAPVCPVRAIIMY